MQSLDRLFSGIDQVTSSFSQIDDVGSAVGALQTLGTALSGGANNVLTLGPFIFENLELPEKINFGEKQNYNLHSIPGGARVVDLLGVESDVINWSGILLGSEAEYRLSELRALLRDGEVLDLRWGENHKRVFISDLQIEYNQQYHILYTISCVEVSDPVELESKTPGFLQSISNDIGIALGVDLPETFKAVNDGIKAVRPLVGTVASVTGNSALGRSINGALNTAQTLSTGALLTSRGNVQGVRNILRTINTPNKAVNAISALTKGLEGITKLGKVDNRLKASINDVQSLQPNSPRR